MLLAKKDTNYHFVWRDGFLYAFTLLCRGMVKIANLGRADLDEADLSGAIVTPKQLDKAWSLKDSVLQDGSKHP